MLSEDIWNHVCLQLIEHRNCHPEYDLCQWRLPWAHLLVDIGNLSCVCQGARDGCRHALTHAAAELSKGTSEAGLRCMHALQPVVEGKSFKLHEIRCLLPFTAASRAKLLERLLSYLWLQRPTTMPIAILQARLEEGEQRLPTSSFLFLRKLHRLNDPTARRLLKYEDDNWLTGSAFNIIPELRLKFGTAKHGWRYAKTLTLSHDHYHEPDCCARCGYCY